MPKRNNKRGGSLASDPYSHLPKQAPNNLPYPAAYDNIISANDLIKNYGSVYKTTGGGVSVNKAYKFVNKFIDNRVLDIYLKYLGITTLTPTTLVPIALIYGQRAFTDFLKYMKRQEQSGGSIPVLDNNLVGTYLKIAGLSQLNLSPHTLVPLGLAMAIYKTFYKKNKENEQKGGHIAKLFTGEYVPPGFLQLGNMIWNGQTIPNNISTPLSSWQQLHRPSSFINHELQTPCSGQSCATDGLPSPPALDKLYIDVKGISGTPNKSVTSNVLGAKPLPSEQGTGTSASSSTSDFAPALGTGSDSSVQMTGVEVPDLIMRNQMAGGGCGFGCPRTSSVGLYNHDNYDPTYDVSSNFRGGNRRRRSHRNSRRNSSKSNRSNRNSRQNRHRNRSSRSRHH